MEIFLFSLLVLGVTGVVAAVLLYFVALKFKVEEDPRIDLAQEALPGANCGGCGFAGCRAFAEACVKNPALEGLSCPVGGDDVMSKVRVIVNTPVGGAAAPAEAADAPKGDGKFDPVIAEKIKALPTPKACGSALLKLAQGK